MFPRFSERYQKAKPDRITVIDRILEVIFLPIFPHTVTPNQITKFRFITIPFVIYLLLYEHYSLGLILFSVSAFSDALDGALARTTNRITDWGKLFDPLADKLLIGSASAIMVSRFVGLYVAGAIIGIELLLILNALYKRDVKKKLIEARKAGKIKMILQSIGICLLFIFALSGVPILLTIATWTLYLAILFALLSLFVYSSI